MPKRPYDLPPMSALVAFEAAARYEGFKLAAAELNVTPAAISHQVKALEAQLRVTLFRRHHRGVALTEAGAYLLVALQRSFEGIDAAVAQLRTRANNAAVTILSTTAMSAFWLTPRLSRFWRDNGQVAVSQIINDNLRASPACDLSLQYGDMGVETDPCQELFPDRIMALASPEFAARHAVSHAEDLERVPLIHLDPDQPDWPNWAEFAAALGYHGPLQTAHRVNNYVIALQAAQDGVGAVLGWEGLTGPHIDRGDLVQLLPGTVSSERRFYIRLQNKSSDRARLVYDWLARH